MKKIILLLSLLALVACPNGDSSSGIPDAASVVARVTLDAAASVGSFEDEATGPLRHRPVRVVPHLTSHSLSSLAANAPAPHPNQGNTSIPQVSFDPRPFLNQTTWKVNYATGSDNNDGLTTGTAIADVAEIRRRWSGGIKGVRPQLPAIAVSVAIADSPASPFSDPHSVLADIDAQPGFTMVVDSTPTIKRSGTVTSVPNAFARTSTGEQTITDVGVADWTSDIDHPLHDTTTDGLTWVISGVGTATLNSTRGAQTNAAGEAASVLANGLSAAAVAATNTYDILNLPDAYFGSGATFRMVPGGTGTQLATIQFRRFKYGTTSSADSVDIFSDGRFLAPNSTGALVLFSECSTAQQVFSRESVIWANSAFLNASLLGALFESPHVNGSVLSGYAKTNVTIGPGEIIDQDFQLHGSFSLNSNFDSLFAGESFIGNVGRFLDGGADKTAVFVNEGGVSCTATYDAGHIFYGTTGSAPIARVTTAPVVSPGGTLTSADTATNTFVFNGGANAFFQLGEQNNAFGFNETTGVYVGPTTATVGHLDAALAAGTGLGSSALWPRAGARIRVAP